MKYAANGLSRCVSEIGRGRKNGRADVPLSELYGVAARVHRRRGADKYSCAARSKRSRSAGRRGRCARRMASSPSTTPSARSRFNALGRILPQTPASEELQRKLSHLPHRADYRNSSLVRSRDHAAGACRAAGPKHPVDVSEVENSHSQPAADSADGSYLELVVSSSKSLLEMSRAADHRTGA